VTKIKKTLKTFYTSMAETVSSEAQNTALASVFFRILRANARDAPTHGSVRRLTALEAADKAFVWCVSVRCDCSVTRVGGIGKVMIAHAEYSILVRVPSSKQQINASGSISDASSQYLRY